MVWGRGRRENLNALDFYAVLFYSEFKVSLLEEGLREVTRQINQRARSFYHRGQERYWTCLVRIRGHRDNLTALDL